MTKGWLTQRAGSPSLNAGGAATVVPLNPMHCIPMTTHLTLTDP